MKDVTLAIHTGESHEDHVQHHHLDPISECIHDIDKKLKEI